MCPEHSVFSFSSNRFTHRITVTQYNQGRQVASRRTTFIFLLYKFVVGMPYLGEQTTRIWKAKYPFYYNFFLHNLFNLDSGNLTTHLSSKEKGPAHYNRQKRLSGNKIFSIDPLHFFSFLEYIGKWERQEENTVTANHETVITLFRLVVYFMIFFPSKQVQRRFKCSMWMLSIPK